MHPRRSSEADRMQVDMSPEQLGKTGASESLEEVFSEADFIPLLWERLQPLVQIRNHLRLEAPSGLTKRAFAATEEVTHDLETFLDDYDARSNVTFSTVTEFIASARGFARTGHTIRHMMARFEKYRVSGIDEQDRLFMAEATATLQFVQGSMLRLLEAVMTECAAFCHRPVSDDLLPTRTLSDRLPRFRLPHNIDDVAVVSQRQRVAEIASLFLSHQVTLDRLFPGSRQTDVVAMRRFVQEVADEEQCRFFEARIHNLQSRYDTYIKGTEAESKDPDLRLFRGIVSLTLHLIECTTQLVHFYERHENDIRVERVKHRIAELVNKDQVLDRTINFFLYYAHYYLTQAVPLAKELVQRYTSQQKLTLTLPQGVVLHARPVGLITKVVNHHATPVNLTIGNATVYAGSILKVLMIVGANPGAREVTFEGDHQPLADLKKLFECRLGEDGVASLHPDLAYLARK